MRSGFTTGTCAAAGAKAAAQLLFRAVKGSAENRRSRFPVSVTLPSGGAVSVEVRSAEVSGGSATASVIKDAGSDPDVTHGAEIVTEVFLVRRNMRRAVVLVRGGRGVGRVTLPGLKVAPGGYAINPVPRAMIRKAVLEAAIASGIRNPSVRVTVSVPRGEELAGKTMNPRLGIVGGISILGTTGIVEPLSLDAYRHSIKCAISVAASTGSTAVVFSTGRSSEKVVEKKLKLHPSSFILTGDHMGFALREAGRSKGIKKIIIAGQFGKFTKLASGNLCTHFSASSIDLAFLARLLRDLGVRGPVVERVEGANTAREAFFILKGEGLREVFGELCAMARDNARSAAGGKETRAVLVGYCNEVVSSC